MKLASSIRVGLWTGAILLAIDVVLVIVEFACLEYCTERAVFAVARIRRLVHPIADPLFNWMIVTWFDGADRVLHVWTQTTTEAVRDLILYIGFHFFEAFLYGFLLGMLASMLFVWLGRNANA